MEIREIKTLSSNKSAKKQIINYIRIIQKISVLQKFFKYYVEK